VIQYADGIYRGQVKSKGSRIRHGFGIIVYKPKIDVKAEKQHNQWSKHNDAITIKTGGQQLRVYEGQWWEDKREGNGYEVFTDGNVYQGQYVKGKPHGRGIYTW
jgi:hypothetical protein